MHGVGSPEALRGRPLGVGGELLTCKEKREKRASELEEE